MQESHLIDNYVRWLETLSPQGAHRVVQFAARDVRCRNPVMEAAGPDAVADMFRSMFDGRQVATKVTDRAAGADGRTVYVRWDRLFTDDQGRRETLSGVSEIMIGMDGKIASIIDHWDRVPRPQPGFLARLLKR